MRGTFLVLASAALAVLFISAITSSPPPAAQTTPTQPNIVFILTDDMRKDDLAYMPQTTAELVKKGMTFNNAYVPLASCCPSRASILRGQYVHNHKLWFSDVHSGGYQGWATLGHESDNLATRLQAGGYSTGLFGKYMNGYSKTTGKPPGWTDWFAMNGGEGYFNYSVNDNGVDRNFGSTSSDYFMDVINTESQQFIQQSVTAGKPFFLYVSPKLPHLPSTPAPRYVNAFNGEPAPRLDSYNEENVSDKPPWISSLPKISSTEAAAIQQRHENRVESLQAADEAVKDIVNKLSATGQLSNTYIVFTSDNGWQHGEHRIPRNKERPYEESSHMPLLIRGPGVATGSTDKLVTFPDFMPTFLELGGIAQPSYIDGRSLVPLLKGTASSWRTAVLLEGRDEGSPERNYFAIRTADGDKYIEYASGFKEYYNLNTDPYEMTSTPGSAPASVVERLQRLKTCAAATCRSIEDEGGGTPPPPTPNPNLLTANQSSAETNLTGFSIYNDNTISRDTTQAKFGSASVNADVTSTVASDGDVFHGIIVDPQTSPVVPANTNVIGSAWVKVPVGKTVSIAVRNYNAAGDTRLGDDGLLSYAGTGDWQLVSTEAVTYTSQDFRPGLSVLTHSSNGAVSFNADGFKVEQGSTVTDWNLGTGGGG